MKRFLTTVLVLICVLLASCSPDHESTSRCEEVNYSEVLETAQKYIDEGKYEDAYKALYGICDYPEAKEMLADFKVLPLKAKGNGSAQTKPRSYVCEYSYDENGVLLSKEEKLPNDVTKTYTYFYDEMGRLLTEAVKKVSPYTGSYESSNKTKTENSSITYTYNEHGDIVKEYIDEAIGWPYYLEYEFEYDKIGRKTSMYDLTQDETTYFTYNEQGQLTEKKNEYGTVFVFEYDQNGNLVKESAGTNRLIEYTYDEHNNLVKMLENYNIGEYNEIKYVHRYTYDKYGVLTAYSLTDINRAEYVEKYSEFKYFYCPEK